MPNKTKHPNPADRQKLILPGYPPYSPNEDIYNQDEQETDIDLDELLREKAPKRMAQNGKNQNKDFDDEGSGLDVPGSELDDEQEAIGSEDEENNYYSIGGDNHNDLEEDN